MVDLKKILSKKLPFIESIKDANIINENMISLINNLNEEIIVSFNNNELSVFRKSGEDYKSEIPLWSSIFRDIKLELLNG